MNVIETTKLTKYYGKSRGIENLDMSVTQGEIYEIGRASCRERV